MKKYLLPLTLLASCILAAPASWAGRETGNGGGTWVCRETNGDIRWATLVDLFEAQNEFGLNLQAFNTTDSVIDIVDQIRIRLFYIDKAYSEEITDDLVQENYLKNSPPAVTYTQAKLKVIDDSLFHLEPEASDCKGGSINYEQLVNYK